MADIDADSYAHLKSLAQRIYAERGQGHTSIQPTVLVHEAWLKLDNAGVHYQSRSHFIAVAARAMRQILIDRSRRDHAAKRGGEGLIQTTLTGLADDAADLSDLLTVHCALDELEKADERAADVAVLRIFGGLTLAEISKATGHSERTASRAWRFARAFLSSRFSQDEG